MWGSRLDGRLTAVVVDVGGGCEVGGASAGGGRQAVISSQVVHGYCAVMRQGGAVTLFICLFLHNERWLFSIYPQFKSQ